MGWEATDIYETVAIPAFGQPAGYALLFGIGMKPSFRSRHIGDVRAAPQPTPPPKYFRANAAAWREADPWRENLLTFEPAPAAPSAK
jgi:hypothetical protein